MNYQNNQLFSIIHTVRRRRQSLAALRGLTFSLAVSAALLILTGLAVATGAVMIRMEDAELEKRFGAEFVAYRQRVHAVVPKLHE